MVTPWKRRGFDPDKPDTYGTYSTLAKNLESWMNTNDISTSLQKRIRNVKGDSGSVSVVLEKEFVKNKAVFHKKCTVEYGQARLDSLKRKFEESEATLRNETETTVSPNKTRRSFVATNFTEMCFFL